jgi:hypothetical protein
MEKLVNQSAESVPSDREQISLLRNLVQGTPAAFSILAGTMKYSEPKARYESGSFRDVDENSKLSTGMTQVTGGKDRVLAAAMMHTAFPEAVIVPMSKTRNADKPTYAAVAQAELIQKKVNPDRIILEENSVSTITEFKEAAKLWSKYQWPNLVFISSNWHLPRAEALFNHLENFSEGQPEEHVVTSFIHAIQTGALTIQFLSSTAVLIVKSKKPILKPSEKTRKYKLVLPQKLSLSTKLKMAAMPGYLSPRRFGPTDFNKIKNTDRWRLDLPIRTGNIFRSGFRAEV